MAIRKGGVPTFGSWSIDDPSPNAVHVADSVGACEGGENNTLVNKDVYPLTQDYCAKVPQDASNKGKTVEYTAYSNNPQKTKSIGSHLNSYVGDNGWPLSVTNIIAEPKEELSIDTIPDTTTYVPDSGTPTSNFLKQMSSTQVSLHQGKDRRTAPTYRRSQAEYVPITHARVQKFGEWDEDCSGRFTVYFDSARKRRDTPCNQSEPMMSRDGDMWDIPCNYGRVPLNRDFGADRAQPLPFRDEGAFGGGDGTTYV